MVCISIMGLPPSHCLFSTLVLLLHAAPPHVPTPSYFGCSGLARIAACRYNDDLGGVLLSYRNARVLTRQASIHPYFPYVRVEVVAEVVLFKPRPGLRLSEQRLHACRWRASTYACSMQGCVSRSGPQFCWVVCGGPTQPASGQ